MPREQKSPYERGGTATVVTNAFATKFRAETLYMYKCQFSNTRRSENRRVPKEDDIVGRRKLFKSIFHHFVELAYGIGVAFDNTRLFAFKCVPGTVTFNDPDSNLGFSVTYVRACHEEHFDVQLEFGEPGRLVSESWNQAMHIVLADAIYRNHFRRVGRGYYDATAIDFGLPENTRKATNKFLLHDSSGVQIWVGWKAKLEDAKCGLILKVARVTRQLASKSVWAEIKPVLKKFGATQWKIADFIHREIRGRPVMTSYTRRVYRVISYHPKITPEHKFNWRGKEISFIDYMRIVYGIDGIDKTQGMLSFKLKKPGPGEDERGYLIPSLCHFTGMPRKLKNFQRNELRTLGGIQGSERKKQMEDMVKSLCATLAATSDNMENHRDFRDERRREFEDRVRLRLERRREYEAKHGGNEGKSDGTQSGALGPIGGGSALDEAQAGALEEDGQTSEDSFVLNVKSDKICHLKKNQNAQTLSDLEFDELGGSVTSFDTSYDSALDPERNRGLWFSDDEGDLVASSGIGASSSSAESKVSAGANPEPEPPTELKRRFPLEIGDRIELKAKILPTTKVSVRDEEGKKHEVLMSDLRNNEKKERTPLEDSDAEPPRIGFFSVALTQETSLKNNLYTLFNNTMYLVNLCKCPKRVEKVCADFVGEPTRDNSYFEQLEEKLSKFIKDRNINLLVFSIPEHKASLMIYETMKRVTLANFGIISQGIKELTFRGSKKETIAHTIAKQILAKIGRPARRLILEPDVKETFQNKDCLVMVCAVDVNHDWQRQASTIGFCSTSDVHFTRVFSQVSYHEKRKEVISSTLSAEHMKSALTNFFEKPKNTRYLKKKAKKKAELLKRRAKEAKKPREKGREKKSADDDAEAMRVEDEEVTPKMKVVMYRDGVSESQFDACIKEEIAGMREGFEEFVANAEEEHYDGLEMELVFTVVQKRVDLKINMPNLSEAVPPGTVIDHTVTSNKFTDYYMIPHDSRRSGGDQSAQCTRYILLREPRRRKVSTIPMEIMQKFTNGLCSLHPTWPGPIRIPHVVKAADLVANQWGTIIQDPLMPKPKYEMDGEKTWIHNTPFYL